MASLHPVRRRRSRRALVAGACVAAAFWGAHRPSETFVQPPAARTPVLKPALSTAMPQPAGLLLGAGAGAFASEGVAFAADEYQPIIVGGVDIIKLAYDLFFAGIILGLLKNNLIDYNGPLAGLFGLETPTARVSHILVDEESQANELLGELKPSVEAGTLGDSFAALALANSTCGSSKSGGSLGLIFQGTMAPEFDAVCFDEGRALGVVHGPIKTEFGHHLILVSERYKGAPPKEEKEEFKGA